MSVLHLPFLLPSVAPELLHPELTLLVVGMVLGATCTLMSLLLAKRARLAWGKRPPGDAPEKQLAFLQTAIDAIPVPIFYKNTAGIYLGCNRAFASNLGLTPEQIVGKSVYELAPESLAESYDRADRELWERGGVQIYENSVRYADGTLHEVLFHKATFYHTDGTLGGLVGTNLEITELKRTEAALRESEERFRCLSEATEEGIVIHDNGIILDLNPAFAKLVGAEASAIIGTCVLDYIVPEDRPLVGENIAAENEKPYEVRGLRVDGATLPIEIHGKEIPYKGKTLRVAAVRNLSDRKAGEMALRASEKRFRTIFEGAAIGIGLASLEERVFASNRALEQMLGYSRDRLATMSLSEFTHPEDVEFARQCYRDLIAGKRDSYQIEKRYICETGNIMWARSSVSLVRDDGGEPHFTIVMVEDITESKRTEEALRESERRFHAIVESIPLSVLITRRADACVVYANHHASPTFGLEHQALIDRPMPDFCLARSDREQLYNELFRQGHLYNYELPFQKRDGTWFWVVLSAVLLEFDREEAILWTFYDITYRVRVEAMLQERSRQNQLSAKVGIALSQGGKTSQILHNCTSAILTHLNASFVGIWTLNPQNQLLELKSAAGEQPSTQEFGDRIPNGFSLVGTIAQTGVPYISKPPSDDRNSPQDRFAHEAFQRDVTSWSDNPPKEPGPGESGWKTPARNPSPSPSGSEATALGGYPLIVEDRTIGVMVILGSQSFSEDMNNLLRWVANSIGVAIERIKVRDALLSRRESLLFRLASQIRNSLELSDILQTAVDEIKSLLRVDRCYFLWCMSEGDRSHISVTHESNSENLCSSIGEYTEPALAWAIEKIRDREIIRIDNIAELDSPLQGFLTELGIVSQLILPIETRASQFGAVVCGHCQPRTWSDSEVELLRPMAVQLAIAIDQAELYAEACASALSAQTQATQLEEALRNLQRTQEQLMQTEKMSSLGQLVAGIAHEINNPVTFITGNLLHVRNYALDLLELIAFYQEEYPQASDGLRAKEEEIDFNFLHEDLPRLLSSMKSGADRIHKIVLSLRSFSRLDEAEMKWVDIHEGLESTLLILQHRLNGIENGFKIEVVKAYGNLPLVECYPGQLNQVFMNLLTNAIDALERRDRSQTPPRITLRTEVGTPGAESARETGELQTENEATMAQTCAAPSTVDSPPDMGNAQQFVTIKIADTGPGMTPEVKARLFDPFFTTKPVGAGTGLGMSISYQIIVKQHRGHLQCISEVGRGTEMAIVIPVRQTQSERPIKN